MALPVKRTQNVFSPATFGGNLFGEPLQYFAPESNVSWIASVMGAGTLQIVPFSAPENGLGASALNLYVSNSYSATNAGSSRADTVSVSAGIYNYSASSLQLAASGSISYAFTVTGSTSSASYQGLKQMSVPIAGYLPGGDYWLAVVSSVSTAGNAIAGALSNVIASDAAAMSAYKGQFGQASAASNQAIFGFGIHSVSQSSIPPTIACTDIQGTAAAAILNLVFNFANYSV